MKDGLKDGVYLFNHGRFFEAHEVLEDLWRDCAQCDKFFLQGLVQLAVSLHHYSTGNSVGALSVLARAEGNLKSYSESHRQIDLKALRRSIEDWRSKIESSERLAAPHIEMIG